MSPVEVLTLGETMGAIRANGILGVGPEPRVSLAGAESNVAIGLSRLGHRAGWVSVLGADAIGDMIMRVLHAEQVDTSRVRREQAAATGILVSQQRPMGQARVDYHRDHSAFTSVDAHHAEHALSDNPSMLHLTGITPALGPGPVEAALTAARCARAIGAQVSLDVNYRSRLWEREEATEILANLARYATIVFGDPGELALLTGTEEPDLETLLNQGIEQVVVKLGDRGARLYTAEADLYRPALNVQVVDPIGAGDAFVAGYLSGLLDQITPEGRLERGNACGAAVVSNFGDWEAMLTRADLNGLDATPGQVHR